MQPRMGGRFIKANMKLQREISSANMTKYHSTKCQITENEVSQSPTPSVTPVSDIGGVQGTRDQTDQSDDVPVHTEIPGWKEGRRIVELGTLAAQMRNCIDCGQPLHLNQIVTEKRIGFSSMLYIHCTCGVLNSVSTNKSHRPNPGSRGMPVFDVNTKAAVGMLHTGIGHTQMTNFMSTLEIRGLHHSSLKSRENEVSRHVRAVAKDSCTMALEEEVTNLKESESRSASGNLYKEVPVPVPELINLFTTGSWQHDRDIEVNLSYKGHTLNLGALSQKTRSLYWERDVAEVPPLMMSAGEKGVAMLVLGSSNTSLNMETTSEDSGLPNDFKHLQDQNENTPQMTDDTKNTPERLQKKKRQSSLDRHKTPTGPSAAKKQKTQKLSGRILSPKMENKNRSKSVLTQTELTKLESTKILTPNSKPEKVYINKMPTPKQRSKSEEDVTKKRTPKQDGTKTRMRTPRQEKTTVIEKSAGVKSPKSNKPKTEPKTVEAENNDTETATKAAPIEKNSTHNQVELNNAGKETVIENHNSVSKVEEKTTIVHTHSEKISVKTTETNTQGSVITAPGRKVATCKDLTTRAAHPSSRWGHSLCFVNKNLSVLIGGQGDKQQLSRDGVWTLDTETRRWKNPATQSEGLKPDSRMGHTTTYDPTVRCIYVFGGSKNTRWFHDVHMLDIDEWKWQLIKVNGKAPTRAYHSATLYRHELWIFGGVYPRTDPQPDGCSNEIHIFSPVMESWYDPIIQGEKPIPRSGHSATLIDDQLVIFGGWDAPISYQDLHILDMSIVEWTQPKFTGTPPKPRSWHASCALMGRRVLIHGGYDGNLALDDTHIFDLGSMSWMQILVDNKPSARVGHKSLCMPYRHDNGDEDEVIIFGGGDNDGKYFDDLLSIYMPFVPALVEEA